MRGYYLGRYRDNALVAAQTEYRFLPFPFSKRWGAATFLGVGTVDESPGKIDFSNLSFKVGVANSGSDDVLAYAEIHNDGGDIIVTKKMKSFFIFWISNTVEIML